MRDCHVIYTWDGYKEYDWLQWPNFQEILVKFRFYIIRFNENRYADVKAIIHADEGMLKI